MINEQSSLLTAILSKLSPADISLKENRLLIAERIEKLMRQNRWSRRHFAILMRREIQPLRAWFGNSYTLTLETITDICQILQISLGDLVAE
jgi:DNA-binding Xre family transcriptional regulator